MISNHLPDPQAFVDMSPWRQALDEMEADGLGINSSVQELEDQIQELHSIIKDLQNRIETLENRTI